MAESEEPEAAKMDLPIRKKQQRQQLTKGMEHMRGYVTISNSDQPSKAPKEEIGEDAYGVPASYQPIRNENAESKDSNPLKRSDPFQFGTRYLGEGDDIFAFNAWDHVQVDPQYNSFIESQTAFQRENQVSDFDKTRFNFNPEKWWDKFYSNNSTNFFKDRKWLVQEFPVLGEVTKESYGRCTVLEVGAGAGNTAFPLLAMNKNEGLRLWACDYSSKAVEVIRSQEAYTSQSSPPVLRAEVWDAASTSLPPGLEPGSVDLVLMIFIFSALSPDQWTQCVKNVWTLVKPGGEVLFRDYGRGDLAQVRFKKGRYLEENFYVRGDGTRVYFFDEDELRGIWSGNESSPKYGTDGHSAEVFGEPSGAAHGAQAASEDGGEGSKAQHQDEGGKSEAKFEVLDLATDRRMLVNRQRKLKMYRCWLQGRFRKPGGEAAVNGNAEAGHEGR